MLDVYKRQITCNAVAPGFIETEMTDVLSDSVKEAMNAQIPMKCFGNTCLLYTSHVRASHQEILLRGISSL